MNGDYVYTVRVVRDVVSVQTPEGQWFVRYDWKRIDPNPGWDLQRVLNLIYSCALDTLAWLYRLNGKA